MLIGVHGFALLSGYGVVQAKSFVVAAGILGLVSALVTYFLWREPSGSFQRMYIRNVGRLQATRTTCRRISAVDLTGQLTVCKLYHVLSY